MRESENLHPRGLSSENTPSPLLSSPAPAKILPVANKQTIAKVGYWHDAIIDAIIAQPELTQKQLAAMFSTSPQYMSVIVNCDAFKNRLAERKEELVDPVILQSVESRLDAVATSALDRLMEELERPGPKKILDLVAAAKLGVGDRNLINSKPAVQNNLYVVHLPSPAASTAEWLKNAQGRPRPAEIIDISHSNPEV